MSLSVIQNNIETDRNNLDRLHRKDNNLRRALDDINKINDYFPPNKKMDCIENIYNKLCTKLDNLDDIDKVYFRSFTRGTNLEKIKHTIIMNAYAIEECVTNIDASIDAFIKTTQLMLSKVLVLPITRLAIIERGIKNKYDELVDLSKLIRDQEIQNMIHYEIDNELIKTIEENKKKISSKEHAIVSCIEFAINYATKHEYIISIIIINIKNKLKKA